MMRLLTTVAFSALVLGVAAPAWAADTSTSSTQTMSSDKTGAAAQTNQNTSSGQAMTGSASTTDHAATKPTATKKKHAVRRHTSSRSSDHMADQLNRQELAKIGGASTTSYGSTGAAAPSPAGTSSPTR
jgi:hypothetical protein